MRLPCPVSTVFDPPDPFDAPLDAPLVDPFDAPLVDPFEAPLADPFDALLDVPFGDDPVVIFAPLVFAPLVFAPLDFATLVESLAFPDDAPPDDDLSCGHGDRSLTKPSAVDRSVDLGSSAMNFLYASTALTQSPRSRCACAMLNTRPGRCDSS